MDKTTANLKSTIDSSNANYINTGLSWNYANTETESEKIQLLLRVLSTPDLSQDVIKFVNATLTSLLKTKFGSEIDQLPEHLRRAMAEYETFLANG